MAKITVESPEMGLSVEVPPEMLFAASFAVAEIVNELEKLRSAKAQGSIWITLGKEEEK